MSKFALFVRATPAAESGAPPPTALLEEMTAFNASLVDAGILLSAEGLLSSSTGTRVSYFSSGAPPAATPGPFDAASLVSGFWIIKAKDLDEAVAWARKVPFREDGAVVEVRQVAGPEHFGDQMTEEIREKENAMREKLGE